MFSDYDDGDVSVIQTIPEDDTIILTNDRYYQDSEPGIFKNWFKINKKS